MLGHRTLTLQDYSTILKRRWWIIAIPAIIGTVLGAFAFPQIFWPMLTTAVTSPMSSTRMRFPPGRANALST